MTPESSLPAADSPPRSRGARAAALATRLVRSLRPTRTSPLELLQSAPAPVAAALGERRIQALPPSPLPKHHWMYRVEHDLLLHVYGHPNDRIGRSLSDREALQKEIALPGVPTLYMAAQEAGRTWVLEDLIRGTPPDPTAAPHWFPCVSEWLVRLGGPAGPALRETEFWLTHQPGAVDAAPAGLQARIARAWDRMGSLPGRSLHGDVQPKNVLLDGAAVGLVDWEGFWRFGVPGLDLVFLALMSARRVPDLTAVEALARGSDPSGRPLLSPLAALGVGPERLSAALLVMLSVWCLGETRRLERNGAGGELTPFRTLLSHVGPAIARS